MCSYLYTCCYISFFKPLYCSLNLVLLFPLYNLQLSPQLLSSYGLANNGHYGQDLETVELDRLSFVIQQAVDILLEKSQNNFEHLHTVEIIINSLLEYFQRLRSSIPLGSVIQSPKLSVEIVLLYGLSKLYIREEPHISIGLKMLLPLLAQLRADDKILLEGSVDLDSNRDCFSAAGPDLSKLDDVDHNFRALDGTIMNIDDTSVVQQGVEKDGNLGVTSGGDSIGADSGPVSAVGTSSTYGSTSSAIPGLPYGAEDYGDIDDSELIPLDLQPLAYDGEEHGQGQGHGEDVDAGIEKGERKGEGDGIGDEEKEGVDEIELIPLAFDNQNEGEHIDPYSGDTDALFPPSEEDMKREQKEVEGLERSAQDSQTFLLRQRLRIAEELTRIGTLRYVVLCYVTLCYVTLCYVTLC
jgi:hypothetical protein